jgi:glycosyltransferase involved in cell wall biosynthesis
MISNDFGVVVIGRNEGQRLIRCLESIKPESRHIVYADSGSTDRSIDAAAKIGAHLVELDRSRPFTAARARNAGFAALKQINPNARYIQFVDGDCILNPGWLDTARAFLDQHSDVAIVCGRRRELHPTASVYNQLCDIEWDTAVGDTFSCGGDSFVRVDAFEAVGGFRETSIAGEEPELCVRLREAGWKVWRLDYDMTRHDAAMMRLGQYWFRALRAGYAYAEVSRLHKSSPFGIWKKETVRAILWGGAIPLIICLGALVQPIALMGLLVYALQICKIAFKRGPASAQSWTYAGFITLAKFAECQGILEYYWRRFIGRDVSLIEYK